MDEEIVTADEQISSNLVAREMMTTETIDGARISATCETIQPETSSDELYLICIPDDWNGELLLYAHGYVSAYEDELTFAEAEELAPLATSLGFAFATTTYSGNGLHILQGIEDMIQLKDYFEANYDTPSYIYLTGGSQGGAITTLALEYYPDLFNGGFSLCGPCGDFEKQLNHYGDFRLLFDYFFGDIVSLPGNVGETPQELIDNWDSYWVPEITTAISNHPGLTHKLLSVSKAPVDPDDPSTIISTVINTLWYNVFTVEDAKLKIDGKIIHNTNRW
jgi:pimeloyl-ACP methyl ester carboxylesterase